MAGRLMSLPLWVMGGWTGMLAWLLFDARYQLFLAPKFRILIFAGMVLSLVFTISIGRSAFHRGKSHIVKGLFLMLPLLFILAAGDHTLGNFALSKRTMTKVRTGRPEPAAQTAAGNPTGAETVLPSAADAPLIAIPELVRHWDKYKNSRVRLEGVFSNTVVDHGELAAVFRYYITCCAADAMPVGVFMESRPKAGLTDNDWVRVQGSVRKELLDGFDIIFMDVESIEKQKKPSKNAAYFFD